MPHAASLLNFPVASLLADGTSDERSSAAMPGPITNDSLKLAPGYVIVAAKMADPESPANSSACSGTNGLDRCSSTPASS